MERKNRAAYLVGNERIEFQVQGTPSVTPGQVLVRIHSVGICGSDVHYYRYGELGEFRVTAPLILGHEASGEIVAVGEGVAATRVGERVAIEPQHPCGRCQECMAGKYNLCRQMAFYATPPVNGALAEYVTIGEQFAHKIPSSMTYDSAALLEPLSVAVAACRRASIGPGDIVWVLGAGAIGLLCTQVASASGAEEVVVTEPSAMRREMAETFGATAAVEPAEMANWLRNNGRAPSVLLDASGIPAAISEAITLVGPAARVVLIGLGKPKYELPIEQIQNKELTIYGQFRYASTWPTAIGLVKSGKVTPERLVTKRYPFSQTREALEHASQADMTLKAIVDVADT